MAMPTKIDQIVTTADGTLCRVTYVATYSADAEVVPIEGGERMTLPRAELKRVPDPRNVRPPVEGMPTTRPRCRYCNKPAAWVTRDETQWTDQTKPRILKRTFVRWRGYDGGVPGVLFCTLNCAFHFAQACVRAGMRIKR